jgi:hypothetical protein
MAYRYAIQNGNFNATSTWSATYNGAGGASVPTTGDTAYANGYTVTINVTSTCLEIRNDNTNSAIAGGVFNLSNGVTLNANVYAGNVALTGGVYGCVALADTVNLISCSIIGNIYAGTVQYSYGINNTTTNYSVINVTGNIYAGSGANSHGVSIGAGGIVNVNGNVYGGSGNNSCGVRIYAAGKITVTGNVTGGIGSTGYGATNEGGGTLIINGLAIGNDYGFGSTVLAPVPGIYGAQNSITKVKGIQCGSKGQWPTAGNVFVDPAIGSTVLMKKADLTSRMLYTTDSIDNPVATNVRTGISYSKGRDNSVARKNLFQFNETLISSTYSRTNITIVGSAPDPFGNNTAYTLTEGSGTQVQFALGRPTTSVAPYGTFCLSFYAKRCVGTTRHLRLEFGGNTNGFYARFNLDTGATTSYSMYGNGTYIGSGSSTSGLESGWYRFWVAGTTISGDTSSNFIIRLLDTVGGVIGYTGDGTSSFYVYGPQIETGSTLSDYQPILLDLPSDTTSDTLTGTMAIPTAENVLLGVPTDNTTGSAIITPSNIWEYPQRSLTGWKGKKGMGL